MSLRRDFNMYYEGTYVTIVRSNGDRFPFLIYGVDNDAREVEGLRFSGKIIKSRGVEEVNGIPFEQLDMKLPQLGYVTNGNGRRVWLSYMSRKTVKKGFHPQRLYNVNGNPVSVNDSLVRAVWFNTTVSDFDVSRGQVNYKGRVVGEVRSGSISMLESARWLASRATEALGIPLATGG